MNERDLRRAAVVLVEYRSDGLVAERADEALAAGCRVVVADNSGTYNGAGAVVDPGGNIGFGAACNLAVGSLDADVDVLVLQNPDATIAADDLATLVSAVRDGWAAVAPGLLVVKRRPYGFAVPSPIREVAITAREVMRTRARSASKRTPSALERSRESNSGVVVQRPGRFGTAALLVLDREAFDAVGGFDEDYFLYAEDLDLWHRLERTGHRVGFMPGISAVHAEAGGSSASVVRRTALRWVGRDLFAARYQSRWWPWYRLLHRVAALTVRSTDPMVVAVRRGYAAQRDPGSILADIRAIAKGGAGGVAIERIRVGWSRAVVGIANNELVLDVGSGAFPNARADVLCERTPERPHRTAIVDRPFVVADALALPFRHGAFDFAIASHLAEHVESPELLCRELNRVSQAGYLETPSPMFERLFPEANHLWRVHRQGPGALRFEPNRTREGLAARLGQRLYRWYYAGQDKEQPTFPASGAGGALVAGLAFVIRGAANRAGLSVTRLRFGPSVPLRGSIARSSDH